MNHLKIKSFPFSTRTSYPMWYLGFVLSALLVIFILSGGIYNQTKAVPDGKTKRINGFIKVDHRLRHYVLYLPQPYDSTSSLPLVFVLHGARSNPKGMQILSQFQALEKQQKFITVYPAAEGNFWNDGREKVNPNIDDVKFINTLIDSLEAQYHINKKGVFAAGMSNGATMSVRLACQSKKIKGIAAVASTAVQHIIDHCRLDVPKPAMFIKGTDDPIANFNGVEKRKRDIVGFNDVIKKFLALDHCTPHAVNDLIPDKANDGTSAIRKRYEDCSDDAEVVSIVVQHGGHTWPGAPQYRKKFIVGRTSRDFSATKIIWDFFQRHIN